MIKSVFSEFFSIQVGVKQTTKKRPYNINDKSRDGKLREKVTFGAIAKPERNRDFHDVVRYVLRIRKKNSPGNGTSNLWKLPPWQIVILLRKYCFGEKHLQDIFDREL